METVDIRVEEGILRGEKKGECEPAEKVLVM